MEKGQKLLIGISILVGVILCSLSISFEESRYENIAYAIKDNLITGLDFQMLLKKCFENVGINPDKIFEEL